MFTLPQIIATAAAIVIGGTGSAAVVMGSGTTSAEAAAQATAKANADLSAAEEAHQQAIAALASTDAESKAKAEALIEASSVKLEQASAGIKAAVDAGSETAVNGIANFTRQSVRLVNGLAASASATADASAKTGARLTKAVEHQVAAARAVATAEGTAALKTLTETSVAAPQPSVPDTSGNAEVSAGAQSNTTASAPPGNAQNSTAGQLGVNVNR